MTKIFLCHSSVDKPFVRKLAKKLSECGVKVWLDEAELRVGHSIIGKLSDAINEADYLAAVISEHSVKSQWVEQELRWALTRELIKGGFTVLPILLGDVELPPFLTDKKYADFRKKKQFNRSVKEVLLAMGLSNIKVPPSLSKRKPKIESNLLSGRGVASVYHYALYGVLDFPISSPIYSEAPTVIYHRAELAPWFSQNGYDFASEN